MSKIKLLRSFQLATLFAKQRCTFVISVARWQCRRQSIQSRGAKSKSGGAKFFIDFSPKKACRA